MATLVWGVMLADYRYVIGPDGIQAGGYSWKPLSVPYFDLADLDHPASASMRMEARPAPEELVMVLQLNRLVASSAELWRLEKSGSAWSATQVWKGTILRASIGTQNNLVLECGPALTAFSGTVPRQFGPLCRYVSQQECAYATSCAKSWSACQANNQTAIFGGFRWLPPAGTRIVIRETMETVG